MHGVYNIKFTNQGYLRTGFWGECLHLVGGIWQEMDKIAQQKSFMVCTYQILLEYWSQGECSGKAPINDQLIFIFIVVQIYLKYL